MSAVSWIFYILASRWLPLSLFGLLSNFEPALLVVVSLMLGEVIASAQWPTYLLIWASMGVLIVEGVRAVVKERVRERDSRHLKSE